MTEYIERGAALAQSITVKHYDGVLGGVCDHEYIRTKDINAIPAADVEPVVRCRYCENGYIPKSDGSYVWCKIFNQSLPFDFYCKYAKEEAINPCNDCEHAPSMCGMDVADCAHMDERSDA